MKKRIIALTILLAFLGLALQAQVSAPWTGGIATGFSGGSGTEDDPWLITTGDELAFLAQQVRNWTDNYEGEYFRLQNDIDLGGALETPSEWSNPIGYNFIYFQGNFDGNNKRILNIYRNAADQSNVGLFGSVGSSGSVKNLTVASGTLVGKDYVAGISAKNEGLIENCYNFADITAMQTGGRYTYAGGIVGDNMGTIRNCANFGTVTGECRIGGIVGDLHVNKLTTGLMEQCINFGTIRIADGSAYAGMGGIAGSFSASYDNMVIVRNCANFGTLDLNGFEGNVQFVSCLVGENKASSSLIQNSFSAGPVLAGNLSINDISSNSGNDSIDHCFNDIQISGQNGAHGVPTSFLTAASGIEGWDAEIWAFEEGAYPMLKVFEENPQVAIGSSVPLLYYASETDYDTYKAVKRDFELPAIGNAVWTVTKGSTVSISGTTATVTRLADKTDSVSLQVERGGQTRQFNLIVLMQAVPLSIAQVEHGTIRVWNGETEVLDGTSVEDNTLLRLEALPEEGWLLDHFLVNGERQDEPSFNVNGQTEISAVFMPDTDPEPWDGSIATQFGGGTGSATAPYQIRTPAELAYLAQQVNAGQTYPKTYFLLVFNLDLNHQEWTPIGIHGISDETATAFAGYFDGNSKSVKHMRITDNSITYAGLFGNTDNLGSISSLSVDSSLIRIDRGDSLGFAGLLAAYSAATLNHCSASGRVEGKIENAGGLTGYGRMDINSCTNYAKVINQGDNAGGIAGTASVANLHNCANLADSIIATTCAGGIAGTTSMTDMINCYNRGFVHAEEQAGGIAGLFNGDLIEQCLNEGSVSGKYAGGMSAMCVGKIYSSLNIGNIHGENYAGGIAATCTFAENVISGVYNLGTVEGGETGNVGEILGSYSFGSLRNIYFDKQIRPHALAVGNQANRAERALLTGQFTDSLPTGFDTTAWQHVKGQYPVLKGLPVSDFLKLQTAALQLHATNDSIYETPEDVSRDMKIFTLSGVQWAVEKGTTLQVEGDILRVNPLADVDTCLVAATLGDFRKEYRILVSPLRYRLLIQNSEGGSILATNTQGESLNSGVELHPNDSVWLSTQPETGYYFSRWFDGDTASRKLLIMDEDKTVSASFAKYSFTITASANEGGSITPSGEIAVEYGASQTFTLMPQDGYKTDSLIVDGEAAEVRNTYTFTHVEADHSIRAVFSPLSFTITASCDEHGSISPSGESTVEYGQSLTYTITPDEGYKVENLLIDGVPVEAASTYTFNTVIADHTIHATFKEETGNESRLAAWLDLYVRDGMIVAANRLSQDVDIEILDAKASLQGRSRLAAFSTAYIPVPAPGLYLIRASQNGVSAIYKILVGRR